MILNFKSIQSNDKCLNSHAGSVEIYSEVGLGNYLVIVNIIEDIDEK